MVCEVLVSHSLTAILFRLHPLIVKEESDLDKMVVWLHKTVCISPPTPQSVDDHPVMSDKGKKAEHTTKNAVKLQLN